jgi:LytS/YehU family sensor histidine kinase
VAQASAAMTAIVRAPVTIALGSAPEPSPFDAVLEIPLRRDRVTTGILRLGQRTDGRPYFSEDAALVASLAEVFSYLLENVRLQAKKQEQDQLAHELSLSASRSELKALRAQINPHFLFNALNAIAGLIHQDPDRADRAVEQLAEVFRYTLRRSESEWARLEDEFGLAGAYLDVEQARFGRRLACTVTLDDAVRGVRVPSMIVQTLVENAVKHGVSVVRGTGRLEVCARADGEQLRIEVADNGPGFADEPASGPRADGAQGGYGLWNVRQRLAGHFGDRAALETGVDTERGMTVVTVTLPLSGAPAAEPASARSDGAA